jgi:hypothetical protein
MSLARITYRPPGFYDVLLRYATSPELLNRMPEPRPSPAFFRTKHYAPPKKPPVPATASAKGPAPSGGGGKGGTGGGRLRSMLRTAFIALAEPPPRACAHGCSFGGTAARRALYLRLKYFLPLFCHEAQGNF